MDVSKVVGLVKKGDTQSFTKLVLKFQNMSLGYAYSLTGDFRQAQDIVQESFLTAYSRIKSLEKDELFPSWLRGIIYRKAHRYFRSHKPYVELTEQFEKGTNCLDENSASIIFKFLLAAKTRISSCRSLAIIVTSSAKSAIKRNLATAIAPPPTNKILLLSVDKNTGKY